MCEQGDLTFAAMQEMGRALQAKHTHDWTPLSPKTGRDSLLWMVEELGEVAAVIKKRGDTAIMEQMGIRAAFVEELCDVLMYYGDVLLCYGITPGEIAAAYRAKHARNMARDYHYTDMPLKTPQ